jgi:hypothetical protein
MLALRPEMYTGCVDQGQLLEGAPMGDLAALDDRRFAGLTTSDLR